MRREEERITRLRLERKKREYEEQRAERMRRAYDEQVQRLEVQRRDIIERVALEYLLDDQNSPLHEPLPPTSVTNPSTVVQNFLPQDGTSSRLTTAVGTQPSVVMNLAASKPQISVAAQPQTTVTGVAVNLHATVNPTTAVSTAISTAQPYIPPWRRPHAILHQALDHNLNAGGPRQDGAVRETTVASAATARNVLQPPNAYLAANAPIGNPFNQVVGAQRNLSHRYSTEWKT